MTRRLLLLLTVLTVLLAALPAAAEAYPSSLQKFGISARGADLENIYQDEIYTAELRHQHIRAVLDARKGPAAYADEIANLQARGITLLPVLFWSRDSSGAPYQPRTPDELTAWYWFARNVMAQYPQLDVYEVWNEPNGSAGGNMTLSEYWQYIYGPIRDARRDQAPTDNLLVGGLCFGTQSSNSCTDASTWISSFYSRGYTAPGNANVNGFAVHPYGYTHPSSMKREQVLNQRVTRAQSEYRRALFASTGHDIVATEFGRRTCYPGQTQCFSERSQADYLWAMAKELVTCSGGVCQDGQGINGETGSPVLSNWMGRDAENPNTDSGRYTSGLINSTGGFKIAWYEWGTHNTDERVRPFTPR